jgi:hypothetical protein
LWPRRTGAPPLSAAGLVGMGVVSVIAAAALLAGETLVAELGIILAWLLLAVSAVLRIRAVKFPPPRSFVLVATGVLFGIVGAALIAAAAMGAPEPAMIVGRGLVSQGVMVAMVLGVAPVLVPVVLTGHRAPEGPTWPHIVAAGLLIASFVVDAFLAPPAVGLGIRAVVATVAIARSGALAPATLPGAHRAMFRLSLLLVPLGMVIATLLPEKRVALMHVAFGGGFALMILAITVHVTLMHGGRESLADRWPMPVVVSGVLVLAATALRAMLEGFGDRYVDAMFAASVTWVAAVVVWGLFMVPKLRRGKP